MQPELIDVHYCVSPVDGKVTVRKYHQYFCSCHPPGDGKSFGMVIPEDQFEATKERLEKDNEQIQVGT